VTKRERPFLSIIIPAFNEEKRLPPTLQRIADFLRAQPYRSEVIIVENGSTDDTSGVVERFIAEQRRDDDAFEMILLHSTPGKGAAVKKGILTARGEYLVISDTDLAVPIEEVTNFLPPILSAQNYAIAIASREVPGAVRHDEPAYRHFMGRVFNFLVRVLAVPQIHDTQCGFKCFSYQAAHQVFPMQTIDGWGFDVEVLFLARQQKLRVIEVPIDWYYRSESKVRPLRDTIGMVLDLAAIRLNLLLGRYRAG